LLFQQALEGVHQHTAAILEQQKQISTGRRWIHPSDDPLAATQSSQASARKSTLERYKQSVTLAQDRLSASATAIQLLTNVLADAKEVAVSAVNSTSSQSDRNSLAQRLDSVIAQVMEVANRKDANGPLFAGTAQGTPYALENGVVTYAGDDGTHSVAIGDTLSLDTNLPGSELFSKQLRKTSLFFGGATGATAGTGSDSAVDRGQLVVSHGVTTWGNGAVPGGGDSVSGIRPGASSDAKDTIIGPPGSHSITVDSLQKTLRLDGGPPVSYMGTETDLAVSDGNGGTVYVNVANMTPGFQGTVPAAATGTLSTDGGATSTNIAFSSNQVIVNSANGSTTNVNTTGIRHAGTETVDYVGTSNLFQALIGLRDDLLNYEKLPVASREASIQARARELDRNFENAVVSLADVGSRVKIAETASSRLGEIQDQVDLMISGLDDVDFANVVVNYNKSQIALQLAQSAGQRLMQLNFSAFLQ
jgi:flagellin-like hook-associated protein FlgL